MPVPGSPFVVHVKSGCDPSRCKAFGPGLQKGITNKPMTFTVETREAGMGGLSLAIEGPSEAKMNCIDNRDGSCDVEYNPTEPGEYDITIRFADKHIPGSPFKVIVEEPPTGPRSVASPSADFRKVKVYGPSIEKATIYEHVPASFFIDVADAGAGMIAVKLKTSDGKSVENVQVEDEGDGIYKVTFIPPKKGAHITANVLFTEKDVPGR